MGAGPSERSEVPGWGVAGTLRRRSWTLGAGGLFFLFRVLGDLELMSDVDGRKSFSQLVDHWISSEWGWRPK